MKILHEKNYFKIDTSINHNPRVKFVFQFLVKIVLVEFFKEFDRAAKPLRQANQNL